MDTRVPNGGVGHAKKVAGKIFFLDKMVLRWGDGQNPSEFHYRILDILVS
jgi:hypothetical protein